MNEKQKKKDEAKVKKKNQIMKYLSKQLAHIVDG